MFRSRTQSREVEIPELIEGEAAAAKTYPAF